MAEFVKKGGFLEGKEKQQGLLQKYIISFETLFVENSLYLKTEKQYKNSGLHTKLPQVMVQMFVKHIVPFCSG